ncbi:C-terminal helicase domain-containing protein [Dyella sp. M7H15-1]|uniref:C-terminal helicase domain-containing protein n=1 Tax=Dyella sp. M7H15-1 TaxID=2501295 RepID=UPI00197AA104|nr:C-terminal helicase domain-containing protein [Dyella sp. M7H15-1]
MPSEKRPALVERFRNDPACRVFLSIDAGATGLNLQHASVLVNMDLPWNPATGAQRLNLPLPSGETASKLADACALLAETLRGRS